MHSSRYPSPFPTPFATSTSKSSTVSSSKCHHAYFTPQEVELLSERQRGKLSATQEEKLRQGACVFLDALGARIGFPRRTIATAQNLYHRFHLFFPRKDFNYFDVALAALFVSTKMHDTLKKPRDLLAVSYATRFPDLAAKSKHPGGEVDLDTMDSQLVEHDRQRLLSIERLILETICFNFTSRMPFPYVIKIGRALRAPKDITKLGWRLAVDCYRTLLPLQYPPHTIALAGIYVAALLSSSMPSSTSNIKEGLDPAQELAMMLSDHGVWETKFISCVEDLEDIAHTLLDILIAAAQSPSANTSPATPASPTPHLRVFHHQSQSSQHHQPQAQIQMQAQVPYKPESLIALKIALREREHVPRVRLRERESRLKGAGGDEDRTRERVGRNEGTMRYLFGPAEMQERA